MRARPGSLPAPRFPPIQQEVKKKFELLRGAGGNDGGGRGGRDGGGRRPRIPTSREDIEEAIRKLEFERSTTSLSLTAEKKLLQRIDQLNSAKRSAGELARPAVH